MPRNGSGVYSKVPGTEAVSGQAASSSDYNAQVDDLVADANAARPIVAGGTGATTAAAARTNLGAQEQNAALQSIADGTSTLVDEADIGTAAVEDFTDNDDLAVDPGNVGSRGNTAAAITAAVAAALPGSRVLLETYSVENFALTTDVYNPPLFDSALFSGYVFEFVNCYLFADNPQFEIRFSTDSGATYSESNCIVRTLIDDGSGGPSTSTTARIYIGDNVSTQQYFNGSITLMRPDQAAFHRAKFELTRSDGASAIRAYEGYLQRGVAEALDGWQLRRMNGAVSPFIGEIRYYGIRGAAS